MDQSELKYAIRVDERAFFIRFYCWLYEADKTKATFCKLFWAYVFVAPALLIRGTVGLIRRFYKGLCLLGIGLVKSVRLLSYAFRPVTWLLDLGSKRHKAWHDAWIAKAEEEREQRIAEREQRMAEPPKPKPEIMRHSLDFIEDNGTRAIMKAKAAAAPLGAARVRAGQLATHFVNRTGEITSTPLVGRLMFFLAACVSLAAVGVIIFYIAPTIASLASGAGDGISAAAGGVGTATSQATDAVIHSKISLWALLGVVGLALVLTAVMGAIAIGLPYLAVKYVLAPPARAIDRAGSTGGRFIGGGLRGFSQVMYLGYYAVKTSTCPRIEVEPRPDLERTRKIEQEIDFP